MEAELSHLSWNTLTKQERDVFDSKRERQAQRAKRENRKAKREAVRRSNLYRIARLQKQIEEENKLRKFAKAKSQELSALRVQQVKNATLLRKQREQEAKELAKRAAYKPCAPWNSAAASTDPWVVFLHDPDTARGLSKSGHDSTLQPLGGRRHFPPGHFADVANMNGPKFRRNTRALDTARVAEKILASRISNFGRRGEFTTNFTQKEVQAKRLFSDILLKQTMDTKGRRNRS